ncbi:response regulator [Vagococcus vulneris]|uniref:DNA-binding response regulator n=1 Tax=Vagococcus vulneris TaxID=1977869 RepID=A0A430A1M9_9ENTE|nr:response regulator transcription factor [Vagococcus vulneris]RSU00280.1 DNA-binding response regulator [Vagococcus vulneris]
MTKLYIAEDQEMLNTALTTILNLEDDLEVVGNAYEGRTALTEINKLKPDIAILDVEMPELTGLEIAEQLFQKDVATKVIILTTFAQKNYFEQAVKAQVNGYLLKDSPTDDLVSAIHDILAGKTIFAPELVTTVMQSVNNPLTKREIDVLIELNQGCSTADVSRKLFLSEGTIRNYISSILSKTGTKNRIEAINTAKSNQWF